MMMIVKLGRGTDEEQKLIQVVQRTGYGTEGAEGKSGLDGCMEELI